MMTGSPDSVSDFTWEDAWFLLAVTYVSPTGEVASLSAIIAAADFINHAILTHCEIEAAAYKLTRDGWLTISGGAFSATQKTVDRVSLLRSQSVRSQLKTAEQWLRARPYGARLDPSAVTTYAFPAITAEMVQAATQAYRKGDL